MDAHAASHIRRATLGFFQDQGDELCEECRTDDGEHFGATGASVVTKPWNGSASRFTDQQYRMSSAACDSSAGSSVKSQCFLPHHEPGGAINKNGVTAAAQRAGSLSGKSTSAVNTAKSHLRSHYTKDLKMDPPSSIGGTNAAAEAVGYELDPDYVEEFQGRHGSFDGKHTHDHAALGAQGSDEMHGHEHTHDGDGTHDHHGLGASGAPAALADEDLPKRWVAVLILEGVQTTDGREISPGALQARPLPLPLMMQKENAPAHMGSVQVGNVETIDRDPSNGVIHATGDFDLSSDDGKEAARNVVEQRMRWLSGDLDPQSYEEVYPDGCDGYECAILRITEGQIMGATMVPFPAFPQAVIVPEGTDLPAASVAGQEAAVGLGMAPTPRTESASIVAAGFPVQPPAWWFEDPGFDGPCFGFRIDSTGRIYGHAALWDVVHIGFQGREVRAPRSQTDYAYYRTGGLRPSEGDEINVGQITLAGDHANRQASLRSAAAHYDNTCAALADVACGEDRFGLWFAGSIRPSVTDEQLRALRASSPSGDWRPTGRSKELVAILAVNVPGFAAPRTTVGMRRVDGADTETALVAAGVPEHGTGGSEVAAEVERQLAPLRSLLEGLAPLAAERIASRIG